MPDEIHTTETPDGSTHSTTIVDREAPPRRGSGVFAIILIIAVLVAAFIAYQFLGNERAETGAITDAAQQVGDAAQNVGDAAQDAVNNQ